MRRTQFSRMPGSIRWTRPNRGLKQLLSRVMRLSTWEVRLERKRKSAQTPGTTTWADNCYCRDSSTLICTRLPVVPMQRPCHWTPLALWTTGFGLFRITPKRIRTLRFCSGMDSWRRRLGGLVRHVNSSMPSSPTSPYSSWTRASTQPGPTARRCAH